MHVHLICKKCGGSIELYITLHVQILGYINMHLGEHKGCTEKDIDVYIKGNPAS